MYLSSLDAVLRKAKSCVIRIDDWVIFKSFVLVCVCEDFLRHTVQQQTLQTFTP